MQAYIVPPKEGNSVEEQILICSTCQEQIEDPDCMDPNHWRCLNDSMWSEVPAVQVISYRMLSRLRAEGWPQELLDMLYLDEDTLHWAKATESEDGEELVVHLDSNGAVLNAGNTVTLVKDLRSLINCVEFKNDKT